MEKGNKYNLDGEAEKGNMFFKGQRNKFDGDFEKGSIIFQNIKMERLQHWNIVWKYIDGEIGKGAHFQNNIKNERLKGHKQVIDAEVEKREITFV